MVASTLADWQNFYVITGSAAAGLMGLTFVVIALAAGQGRVTTSGLRAFVTPTIVHFGTVLALAGFLAVPRQNALSLTLGFGALGAAGLIYGGRIGWNMSHIGGEYVPVGEDWLWHVALPTVVYGSLLVLAIFTQTRGEKCLYGVAAASMALLFIGIHNAWDVAVSITMRSPKDPPEGSA